MASSLGSDQGMHKGGTAPKDDATQGFPSLHAFAGSQGVSIGAFSATTVGRDFIHCTINNVNAPSTQPQTDGGSYTVQAQRSLILDMLKAPSFHAVYQQGLSQRMADTGLWFLELDEFKKFMNDEGVVLWCTGMPGAGKTILAAASIEYLERTTKLDAQTTMAFVFIRYSERYTLRDLLAALLSQLVKDSDAVCAIVWPLCVPLAENEGSELVESGMVAGLREIATRLDKVHVVIDGLDEASDEVKDSLLEALVSSGVNLLIFSRPLDLFTHHAPEALFISIQARTEDIEAYVRAEVSRSSRLRSIIGNRPDKVSELCDKVNESSKGMFLVAKLQMEAIKRTSRSASSLFRSLQDLPVGLSDMYALTLRRIEDSDDSSIAFRAFAWILSTGSYGLEPACLQEALSFDLEAVKFDSEDLIPIPLILKACHGLVEVTYLPYNIRFIHYTTHEYIKSIELVGIPDPSSLIALTCLACVGTHRQQLLDLHHKLDRGKEFSSYLGSHQLLRYSHVQWKWPNRGLTVTGSLDSAIHSLIFKDEPILVFLPGFSLPNKDSPTFLEIGSGVHFAAASGITSCYDPTHQFPLVSNPGGYTPFHLAAMRNRLQVFEALLSSYSGVNLPSADGSTVLHLATWCRHISFISQLYHLGLGSVDVQARERPSFDVNAQDSTGTTPLMIACRLGLKEAVRLFLLCEDVKINSRDSKGYPALIYATQEASSDMQDDVAMAICSQPGLDCDVQDEEGNSPFILACKSGLVNTAQKLLAGDPTLVQQTNMRGETAMIILCHYPIHLRNEARVTSYLATFELLLAHGSDLNVRDDDGMSPFLLAVDCISRWRLRWRAAFQESIMRKLFATDPTLIDQRDNHGRTALMIAAKGDPGLLTVQWLLSGKEYAAAYINAQDNEGKTAFIYSCYSGALEVVDALLGLPGLDIYARCHRGMTAMDWAFEAGPRSSVSGAGALRMLVECGQWETSAIRMTVLRALKALLGEVIQDDGSFFAWQQSERERQDFIRLLILGHQASIWNLEDTHTIVFLAYAARKKCRLYIATLLSILKLTPLKFNWQVSGMGICPPEPREHAWDLGSHRHDLFQRALWEESTV